MPPAPSYPQPLIRFWLPTPAQPLTLAKLPSLSQPSPPNLTLSATLFHLAQHCPCPHAHAHCIQQNIPSAPLPAISTLSHPAQSPNSPPPSPTTTPTTTTSKQPQLTWRRTVSVCSTRPSNPPPPQRPCPCSWPDQTSTLPSTQPSTPAKYTTLPPQKVRYKHQLLTWRSTVSVCTHTPSTQSTTTRAPSVMRRAAVTSELKST